MLLSRTKSASASSARPGSGSGAITKAKDGRPTLASFLAARDFSGAAAIIEFLVESNESEPNCSSMTEKNAWLVYVYFHLHDFAKTLSICDSALKEPDCDPMIKLFAAACHFYLGDFEQAVQLASSGPSCSLQYRTLLHCAHRMSDEKLLVENHSKLTDSFEDQLGLAAFHFLRGHYNEATEIYKRLLLEHRDYLALQVYIAICYYKLDYPDVGRRSLSESSLSTNANQVSLEILNPYLTVNPDSAIAINVKACSHFRLYDGNAAVVQLQGYLDKAQSSATVLNTFSAHTLISHNMVVFRGGDNALKVFPSMIDIVPEARLNLCIYYLKVGDLLEAYKLMKAFDPTTPQGYIMKGVTHVAYGQSVHSTEDVHLAQQYFQLIGEEESEMDTIHGRQAMASCYFLLQQFDDVIVYLSSIEPYFQNDDRFSWNYGVAFARLGRYSEAAQAFAQIQNPVRRKQYDFIAWSARVHIYQGQANLAWEMYSEMENSSNSFKLLLLIANECYRVQAYYYAAKAFDLLWKLDPVHEYWEGKRGACCGVLQLMIAGKEKRSHLAEVINLLKDNSDTPQAQFIARAMNKYWLETS